MNTPEQILRHEFEKYWLGTFDGLSSDEIIKYKYVGKDSAKNAWNHQQKTIDKLKAQNEILLEAVKFYADDSNWLESYEDSGYFISATDKDISIDYFADENHCGGHIAREALKALEREG